jgi:hypothetical protein
MLHVAAGVQSDVDVEDGAVEQVPVQFNELRGPRRAIAGFCDDHGEGGIERMRFVSTG